MEGHGQRAALHQDLRADALSGEGAGGDEGAGGLRGGGPPTSAPEGAEQRSQRELRNRPAVRLLAAPRAR
eukprot:16126048-Heterocapsa_arctica.AAC.1